ncbi:MAG: M20/M25/M40 family metallo-hydrolase [Clostridia bacterium]|nr:M20/M25/M40 family metallo-hydrolase [Clostridia bacterium]
MKELLDRLCTARGVSGCEENVCDVIAEEMKRFTDDVVIDVNNNVIAVMSGKSDYNILLDAHIDQIGYIVMRIDDNGFLLVHPVGGTDVRIANDTRMRVLTESGDITAVVCCIPPHLNNGGADKASYTDTLWLDTGLDCEQVKKRVNIGDTVVYDVAPAMLLNNYYTCGATDNRACCAALLRVAEMIKESPVCPTVTFAFTSQEETYGKGAMTAAYKTDPNEAIALDVTFAAQTGVKNDESGLLGSGGMIGISPVLSRRISDKLKYIASQNKMPYQMEVMGGLTGTNADKISVTKGGIPTGLLSVPQRNMHTGAEIVSIDDIENTAKLVYEYLRLAESE